LVHGPGRLLDGHPACLYLLLGGLVSMYAGTCLNADVSKGITGRFRSLPVWRPAPVAGAILGDVARYLIAAGLVTVLGLAMGYRPPGGAPGVLAGGLRLSDPPAAAHRRPDRLLQREDRPRR
jgi:hypothetical protein